MQVISEDLNFFGHVCFVFEINAFAGNEWLEMPLFYKNVKRKKEKKMKVIDSASLDLCVTNKASYSISFLIFVLIGRKLIVYLDRSKKQTLHVKFQSCD